MTAVKWLENQIKTSKYYFNLMEDIQNRSTISKYNIFEQAQEMEKQQGYSEEDVKAAWNDGSNQYSGIGDAETYFEQLKNK
jgi:hypothetical protein